MLFITSNTYYLPSDVAIIIISQMRHDHTLHVFMQEPDSIILENGSEEFRRIWVLSASFPLLDGSARVSRLEGLKVAHFIDYHDMQYLFLTKSRYERQPRLTHYDEAEEVLAN